MSDEEQPPLSDEELKALRTIITNEARMVWLRSAARVWLAWIAGGILTGFAVWKAVTEFLSIKIGIR